MSMQVECVLFDLGGVVVELTGVETMIEWSGGNITEEEVWHRWLRSDAVRTFESGKIDIDKFGEEIVAEMGLTVPPEEFLRGFGSWIGGKYEGTDQILTSLRSRLGLGCLSNTNPLHWEIMTGSFGLHDAFDHHFLSFRIGMMKPDREIFDHVIEQLDHAPERILYFDDNHLNVESARAAGLRAERVKGMREAKKILEREGLL